MDKLLSLAHNIYFSNRSFFLLKVNTDDFCFCDDRLTAVNMLSHLAKRLSDDLSLTDELKSGWATIICQHKSDKLILINKLSFGRLYNSSSLIYTLTFVEVNHGITHPLEYDDLTSPN